MMGATAEIYWSEIDELKRKLEENIAEVQQKDIREFYRELAQKYNPEFKPEHQKYFATSLHEIDPFKIKAEIEVVTTKKQKELFRSALSFWSIPVSSGCGRRIRVTVWDTCHNKIMGIISLNDPLITLSVRDRFIGWNKEQRHNRLYNMLSAHVLGAVPPYNQILGGKLIALLAGSREIVNHFKEKYRDATTLIRKRKPIVELVAIDTMGAFGQSAVYHSLKEWKFTGYTKGMTHYHLTMNGFWETAYELAKLLNLKSLKQNDYGNVANWKFRVLYELFSVLGINHRIFETGHKRAYYFRPLVENWREFLTEKTDSVVYTNRTADEYFELWKEKWLKRRLNRYDAV